MIGETSWCFSYLAVIRGQTVLIEPDTPSHEQIIPSLRNERCHGPSCCLWFAYVMLAECMVIEMQDNTVSFFLRLSYVRSSVMCCICLCVPKYVYAWCEVEQNVAPPSEVELRLWFRTVISCLQKGARSILVVLIRGALWTRGALVVSSSKAFCSQVVSVRPSCVFLLIFSPMFPSFPDQCGLVGTSN